MATANTKTQDPSTSSGWQQRSFEASDANETTHSAMLGAGYDVPGPASRIAEKHPSYSCIAWEACRVRFRSPPIWLLRGFEFNLTFRGTTSLKNMQILFREFAFFVVAWARGAQTGVPYWEQ